MTQNALRKEPDAQANGQVSEALSSIRSVIKQNLEQGFDHFNDPREEENEGEGEKEADAGYGAEKPLRKEQTPEGVPLETKESLEALIKESEKKEAPSKKTSDSADVFVLTQVLEEDGSVTNLGDKEKESGELKVGKTEVIRADAEAETPAAPETPKKEAPSAEKETPEKEAPAAEKKASAEKESSAEADAEAPKVLGEAEELKEDAVAEPETETKATDEKGADALAEEKTEVPDAEKATEAVAESTKEETAAEFDPVTEGAGDAETQEASEDVAQQEQPSVEPEKQAVPAPEFSEEEALILDRPLQEEAAPPSEEPAADFEIGVEDLLEKATKAPSEDLASKETMAESAAAFSELADIARQLSSKSKKGGSGDGPSGPVTPERAGGYTVEELMRELLRPMLKDWLDTHLPSLVKWLVTEQIEKMLQGQGISTSAPAPAEKPTQAAAAEKPASKEAVETVAEPADTDFDAASMDFDAPGDTSAA